MKFLTDIADRFDFDKLFYGLFCLCTAFMVFLSTSAVNIWPHPWNRISILAVCAIPILYFWFKLLQGWSSRIRKPESIMVLIILALGMLNIIFSEDRPVTLKVMILFLVSGIGVFGAGNILFQKKDRIAQFLGLCWAMLIGLCVFGALEYLKTGKIHLLSYNPIPAGSLVILLLAGPFFFFRSSTKRMDLLIAITMIASFVLIIGVGKRGPLLGLVGMALLSCFFIRKRAAIGILILVILVVTGGYAYRSRLPDTITNNLLTDRSLTFRLENYIFAGHIYLKKPLFGVGLHAPVHRYLEHYQQTITDDPSYRDYIKELKTFENMLLCSTISMGGLLTLAYISLISIIICKFIMRIKHGRRGSRWAGIMLALPIFAFALHSMTFDSLMYPHLNWMFHSYLALIHNFEA